MPTPTIVLEDVHARYGKAVHALQGVSLEVEEGGFVALLGPNGAGKSTVTRVLAGLLPEHAGSITSGRVLLDGHDVRRLEATQLARRGIGLVMEGRRIFRDLTVVENLRAGNTHIGRRRAQARIEEMLATFPRLAERASTHGGNLSGGEQQVLAIARALMRSPRVLILDEPSLGLAPSVVEKIAATLVELSRSGVTILLAEQSAAMAISVSRRFYVLDHGTVAWSGSAETLAGSGELSSLYFGGSVADSALATDGPS